MEKLEKALVEQATLHYLEARSWAEERRGDERLLVVARRQGLTVQQLVRHEWRQSVARCLALCDLSHLDCGLSVLASNSLNEIRVMVARLQPSC